MVQLAHNITIMVKGVDMTPHCQICDSREVVIASATYARCHEHDDASWDTLQK